jgi:hypothetical protein
MRISLIGPGDISYHFFELLGYTEEDFYKEVGIIGEVLSVSNVELVLTPDRGVCFEVAKKYKEFGGVRIIGTVPREDEDFGVEHLKEYVDSGVFDDFINTGSWYKQDLIHCLFGDVILMLGKSLGSVGELVYAYYLYRLKKKLHKDFKAGDRIPFSVIIYSPFTSKLGGEVEAYIKKLKCEVYYVNNPNELKKLIEELKKAL